MKRRNSQKRAQPTVRGFEYLIHRAISISLLFMLVFVPLAPAFASEEILETAAAPETAPPEEASPAEETSTEPEEVEVPAETMTETADEETSEPLDTEESLEDDVTPPPSESPDTENLTPQIEEQPELESAEEPIEEGETEPASTDAENPVSDTEEQPELESAADPVEEGSEEVEETPAAVEIIEEETSSQEESSEEDERVPEQDPVGEAITVNTVTNDKNRFTFGKDECVSVGDGSYYCSDEDAPDTWAGTDRVFSDIDEEGDREIYIEKDQKKIALTDNNVDDEAPYYDERSRSIVWHRLIDGRYQIVAFDLEDEEEEVLTADRYNNMEPSRYGDVTVWQGWVGDDWEIMLHEDGEITMLTDNTHHDIAPRINGDYIMWQSFEENAWRVKVYDVVTEHTETIENADGTSVGNPRFVLVYEAEHENGDIETKGYDPLTKEVIPLTTKPAPVPEEIPDPDQTGEDRALLQTVTQLKPKNEGESEPEPEPIDPEAENDAENLDDTEADVHVPAYAPDPVVEVDEEVSDVEELVVPPLTSPVPDDSTEHIEDVVVTPFISPEPVETDSQTGVASAQ